MVLQFRDELTLRSPGPRVDAAILVIRMMETASEPAVVVSVPIRIDTYAAENWDEAR